MKIGISAEFLSTKRNGTATYTRTLLQGLAAGAATHDFYPYVATPAALPMVPAAPHLHPRVVGPYAALVRVPLTLPAELVRRPVDLVHTQNWAPPWLPCPLVVTTHDIVWELFPELFPALLGLRVRLLARHAARRAVRVITVSQHSAADLHRVYAVPEERLRVVPVALDTTLAPAEDADTRRRLRARYQLDFPYIVSVGSIEPRKRVDRLIRAFAELRRRYPVPHHLVIAGRPQYAYADVLALPRHLGVEALVHFLGPVPDEDLAGLYTGADLFASLPAYEGFGIPPLEAMACGTPVLSANTTSLPEVIGEAGLLVDPDQPAVVVDQLHRALTDQTLRARLRMAGWRNITRFHPDTVARQVVAVYEEVGELADRRRHADRRTLIDSDRAPRVS